MNTVRLSTRIDREPRGASLAGKVTNFSMHHDVRGTSYTKELDVCQVSTGGCGTQGQEMAPKI